MAILLATGFIYLNNRNRTLSPPGSAMLENGALSVSVSYSRPSVRDRLVFGPEGSEALQPYGVYWRLGANESTEVTFGTDILFNGNHVSRGTYRMYAVPGSSSFKVGLNTELGKWGYYEPDYSLDVITTNIPVIKNNHVEQHTINLEPFDQNGVNILVEFSDVKLIIPVVAQ